MADFRRAEVFSRAYERVVQSSILEENEVTQAVKQKESENITHVFEMRPRTIDAALLEDEHLQDVCFLH